MNRLYALLILTALTLTGFIDLLLKRKKINNKINFTHEYLNSLAQYLSSKGQDVKSYAWLLENSVRMQNMLGSLGVADYKPPGTDYFIRNYQVVINFLPELRRAFETDRFLSVTSLSKEFGQGLVEVLCRFLGLLKEASNEMKKDLCNPLVLFRNGVQNIIMIPFYIVSHLGFKNIKIINKKGYQIIIRIFTFLISLITLIAALLTIILSWERLNVLIQKISDLF